MTVRLRPHHLLCMLTYVGKGYTPAFIANYDAVIARLAAGEDVLIVDGPDDICVPLLSTQGAHCRNDSVVTRDAISADEIAKAIGIGATAGSSFRLESRMLSRLRVNFAQSSIRTACHGCEWSTLCDVVADSGYVDVRLKACRP